MITRQINFVLTWSPTCVISSSTGETKFKITNTKLYVPVVTLSTQDNRKLLQQLKSCFKRTINWNKYQSTPKTYRQNRCLSHLFDPIFQVVNRLFVLSFEHEDDKTLHSAYYLPKVEIKDYNVMNFGKNFFDQPINSDFKTYENIRKKATGQEDDYAAGCLLDCSYFKKNYRMIAIDLIKQQILDVDPRAIQQINFAANLDRDGDTAMFFIIEEAKETVFEFSQGTVKVL